MLGFTAGAYAMAREHIMAMTPAPITVGFLGYPVRPLRDLGFVRHCIIVHPSSITSGAALRVQLVALHG